MNTLGSPQVNRPARFHEIDESQSLPEKAEEVLKYILDNENRLFDDLEKASLIFERIHFFFINQKYSEYDLNVIFRILRENREKAFQCLKPDYVFMIEGTEVKVNRLMLSALSNVFLKLFQFEAPYAQINDEGLLQVKIKEVNPQVIKTIFDALKDPTTKINEELFWDVIDLAYCWELFDLVHHLLETKPFNEEELLHFLSYSRNFPLLFEKFKARLIQVLDRTNVWMFFDGEMIEVKRVAIEYILNELLAIRHTQEEDPAFIEQAKRALVQEHFDPTYLKTLSSDDLIYLLQTLPESFRALDLRNCVDSQIPAILDNLPSTLQEIDLSGAILGDLAFVLLAKRCPKLSRIRIVGALKSLEERKKILDQWQSLSSLKTLEELDVRECRDISPEMIMKLIRQSPNLKKLRLGGSYSSKDEDQITSLALNSCPRLQEIIVDWPISAVPKNQRGGSSNLTLDLLSNRREAFRDLRKVKLQDHTVNLSILHLCPNLKSLDLSKLSLNLIHQGGINQFFNEIKDIEKIKLRHVHLTEEMVDGLKSLQKLRSIDLSMAEQVDPCKKNSIDDDLYKTLANNFPRLEKLKLDNRNISDDQLIEILKNHQFTTLSLLNCRSLSIKSLLELSNQNKLKTLVIGNSRDIIEKMPWRPNYDKSLIPAVKRTPAFCDSSLAQALSKMPWLKKLSLKGCHVSEKTLNTIGDCLQLERLVINEMAIDFSIRMTLFARLSKIKTLKLPKMPLQNIKEAISKMPLIENLKFYSGSEDDMVQLIEKLPQIKAICMKGDATAFSKEGLKAFSKLHCLEKLILGSLECTHKIKNKIVRNNPRLRKLGREIASSYLGHPTLEAKYSSLLNLDYSF